MSGLPRRFVPLLGSLLVLIVAHPAGADAASEALLGQRGTAFVAAMNAQDAPTLEAFVRDHLEHAVANEGRTDSFVSMMHADYAEFGAVEKHNVQVLGDGKLVFVFCKRARGGAWLNYQFRVIANDENRLKLVFRALAIEPRARPSTPIRSPASQQWLRDFASDLESQQPFSGVIVVRGKDEEIFTLVRGLANAPRGTAVTRDTRFGMASAAKMFTAIAILQLDQAGKLSVGDTLLRHLPDFPDQGFAKRVTLHQLLTHTAGAGDYWDETYEREWGRITELEQMLPFVRAHLGETPAGEFTYSNSGYVLLGLVIEAVSGMSYYDYVSTHVFGPAGMEATAFPLRSEAGDDTALPYEPEVEAGAVKLGSYIPVLAAHEMASALDDIIRNGE